jgi:adenine-specific DNA methylase
METIKFNDSVITLKSKYQGTARPWGEQYIKEHYRVFVEVDDVKFSFSFYQNEYPLKETDLIFALYCCVSDALNYVDYPEKSDFAAAFGFTYEEAKQANQAYNSCRRLYEKLEGTGFDLYELARFLFDKYDC